MRAKLFQGLAESYFSGVGPFYAFIRQVLKYQFFLHKEM
jgi:hypothetical protein